MKKVILLFILVILSVRYLNSQWYQQISGTTTFLYSVSFSDSNTGYIVGSNSIILKTTNGGNNWNTIGTGNWQWYAVFFLDNSTGFVGGFEGLIKTTNGGDNWTLVAGETYIRDIYFLNTQTGFFITDRDFYRTTDGGNYWNPTVTFTGSTYLKAIHFIDGLTGFVCGRFDQTTYKWGKIWKTTDGGYTWMEKLSIQSLYGMEYKAFGFSDNNHGYCGGYINGSSPYTFVRTDNCGESWNTVNNMSPENGINSIVVVTMDTVYVCGDGGLFKTNNAGITWTQQIPPPGLLFEMSFFNSRTGWVAGSSGRIYCTTNGGGPLGIVQIGNKTPANFSLSQNYPNPFNPVTRIKFSLPSPRLTSGQASSKGGAWKNVRLVIYDILGREVATLIPPLGGGQEGLKPGSYEVTWDGSRHASGVYFYKLVTDEYVQTRKMVLIK